MKRLELGGIFKGNRFQPFRHSPIGYWCCLYRTYHLFVTQIPITLETSKYSSYIPRMIKIRETKNMSQTKNQLADVLKKSETSRRGFLKSLGHVGLVSMVASPALLLPRRLHAPGIPEGFIAPPPPPPLIARSELALSLYNTHTGESLKNHVFCIDGQLIDEQLASINRLFRDHRTNQIHAIDPELLKLLVSMKALLETTEPIHLVSGYRSPQTNRLLATKNGGVATKSQHLCGKAADIKIPHRSLKQLQRAAKSLKKGGVGRYSSFVHVDTGRVRTWGLA